MAGNRISMTLTEVMGFLEAHAHPSSAKTLANHGVPGPCFGVLYSELYKLQKKLRGDQKLANELWETEVHDARILTTLIGDPAQMDEALLEKWLCESESYALAGEVARGAVQSPHAIPLAMKWKDDAREWFGQYAWMMFAFHGEDANKISDELALKLIGQIEKELHSRKNRVRQSMMSALVSLGLRDSLRDRVFACADAVGSANVDHGNTCCRTPEVRGDIERTLARRALKKPR